MAPSFSADAFARLGDGIRRIEDQATSGERDADALLRTAQTDAQLAMGPFAHPRDVTAACVDLLEMAALAQLGRCEAAVAAARRLCASAREHRLLAHQLLVDFAAGSGTAAPAPLVDWRRAILVVDDIEDARELATAVPGGRRLRRPHGAQRPGGDPRLLRHAAGRGRDGRDDAGARRARGDAPDPGDRRQPRCPGHRLHRRAAAGGAGRRGAVRCGPAEAGHTRRHARRRAAADSV